MWVVLVLVGLVTYLIYYLLLRPSPQYWKKYGILQVSDIGSVRDHIRVLTGKQGFNLASLDERAYHQVPDTEKVFGIFENAEYGNPVLIVKDLEMVKTVMVKDFDHFVDQRGFLDPDSSSPLNLALFNLKGDQWKGVRSSVSPTFTTGKIRRMNNIVNQVCQDWVAHFKDEVKKTGGDNITFKVLNETTNYTVDVIAAAFFGINAEAIRNPKSGFGYHARKMNEFNIPTLIRFTLGFMFPKIASFFKLQLFPKETTQYFVDTISQGLKTRVEGKMKSNDFLQILAEAKKGELKVVGNDELSQFEKDAELKDEAATKKNWLENDDVVHAQIFQFFIAGFSTTSSVLSFSFFSLALNPDIQTKLREEVDKKLFADGNEQVDYDEVNKLPYLDMIVCEVLRKFPVITRHERLCTTDYYNEELKINIPKGAIVGIPVQAIHNDKKYYERPDEFYPEHFTPEKKAERNPYAYQAFGHGPRSCIGMRFALVNAKAAISYIVHNFNIQPATSTPKTVKEAVQGGRNGVFPVENLELKFVPIR